MNSAVKETTREKNKVRMEFDNRDTFNTTIITKNAAYLYAYRPLTDERAPELPYLSLYEFFRYWRIELAAYVVSDKDLDEENDECYQAKLTMSGLKKINMRRKAVAPKIALVGGTDYEVKEEGGTSWIPFPKLPELEKIRQTWVLVRNERPLVPSFHKAPMPDRKNQDRERNAMLVMTYFHPFTLCKNGNVDVPHVSDLRQKKDSWETALVTWLSGCLLYTSPSPRD